MCVKLQMGEYLKNLYHIFNKEIAQEFGLVEAVILQMVLDTIEIRARVEVKAPNFEQSLVFTKAEIEYRLCYLNLEEILRVINCLKARGIVEVGYLRSETDSSAAISIRLLNPARFKDYLFLLAGPHDD